MIQDFFFGLLLLFLVLPYVMKSPCIFIGAKFHLDGLYTKTSLAALLDNDASPFRSFSTGRRVEKTVRERFNWTPFFDLPLLPRKELPFVRT